MASLLSASFNPDLSKPETDLAEWTSKIKALQKQVDADEEAEQKRLEDEIVAARQARLRRRSGMDTESRFNSLEICMSPTNLHGIRHEIDTCNLANDKEDLNLPISAKDNHSDNSGVERQLDRDTALRKLMGTNNVHNPDKISAPVRSATEKPGSTSLAAFIGGRASGPRLNRHAPQQDAHDPTQFVHPDTSHPHPVFGRGGIAMPGMATKKGSNVHGSNAGSESSERYRPSLASKPKSPSLPTVNVSSKIETSNLSSVDISRRSFTGPSKVAERYNAKVEESPVHLGTEIPQPNRPSFRTTKSTSSAPSTPTKKDTGQKQESYSRDSKNSNRFADRPLSNVPIPTSGSPPVSVSTAFSAAGPLKAGYSNKPDTPISTINPTPKSTSPFFGAQSSVKPLTAQTDSPERARNTPLRKLMETNNIHNPDKAAAQASRKSEASSLAAFIGGRATGPRLNRHAPQQDIHDPTQFVQPDLSAPHPIFGKGGIAMPGMVTKPSSSHNSVVVESSFSTAVKSTLPSGHSRNEKAGGRERTTSASSPKELESVSISHSARGGTSSSSPSVNRRPSPTKESGARSSTRDRTTSTPSYHSIRTSHELSRSSVSPTPSSRSSNSTLGLAQPIRHDTKVPSTLPQIPPTYMPSPAFQKPLSQKDPTPSISRLQGRGFVQSMVKVSAELETSFPITPSPGKPRPASGRKNAVLDRWQPSMQADTSPTRPTSSYPDVMRRSTTLNTMNTTSDNVNVSTHATGSSRTLKSVSSLPSLAKAATPKEIDPPSTEPTRVDESLVHDKPPGLGSASTMVVIKPSKSFSDLDQMPRLDELGMKHDPTNYSRQDKGSHFSPHSENATSSRKPLIHVR